MRNSLLRAAVLAAIAAGCRKPAPPPAADAGGSAPAPPPPPAAAARDVCAASYTNEMQAANIRAEAAQMGIRALDKPSEDAESGDAARPPITYEEGLRRTKEYARDFEVQRLAIDRNKPRAVALPGSTPQLIPARAGGAPVQDVDVSTR